MYVLDHKVAESHHLGKEFERDYLRKLTKYYIELALHRFHIYINNKLTHHLGM